MAPARLQHTRRAVGLILPSEHSPLLLPSCPALRRPARLPEQAPALLTTKRRSRGPGTGTGLFESMTRDLGCKAAASWAEGGRPGIQARRYVPQQSQAAGSAKGPRPPQAPQPAAPVGRPGASHTDLVASARKFAAPISINGARVASHPCWAPARGLACALWVCVLCSVACLCTPVAWQNACVGLPGSAVHKSTMNG